MSKSLFLSIYAFREFKRLALGLLDKCFQENEELTQQLLTYHLENWGGQTCLSLAVAIEHEEFLAHSSCQALLTDIWTGAMKNTHRSSIKVRNFGFAVKVIYKNSALQVGTMSSSLFFCAVRQCLESSYLRRYFCWSSKQNRSYRPCPLQWKNMNKS